MEATVESLALLAALIGLAVLVSGPLALTAVLFDYVYVGTVLGAVASALGLWWAYTVRGAIGWVGIFSAAMGIAAIVLAERGKPPV